MSAKRKRKQPILERINEHAAGIDVGASMHCVAAPPGSSPDGMDVKEFGAFTEDLVAIVKWLLECGVTTVAIESTGVYWIPLFDLIETHGIAVQLVDPRQLKRVPGKKTDILDCQWLQELHTLGLLAGAFRPPEQVTALRTYVRQRDMLVRYASDHVQHIQKALTQMNIKLQHVVADITGVTGMTIIRAIVAGERSPKNLAAHRRAGCKHDEATIAKALEGTWRDEHLFSLRQALELFDFYHDKIAACDAAIEVHLAGFPDRSGGSPPPSSPKRRRRKSQPNFDLRSSLISMTGVDLTAIEGLEATTVLKVVSETGVDMTQWLTDKHFSSWLGLCPGSKKSGGRNYSSRTKPCANRAAAALRLAAQSLHHSHSYLGAFLRRKAAQHGMPKAITATAHKLARLIYSMLKHGSEYVAKTQEDYEQSHRQRTITNLSKNAKRLGYILVPAPLPAAVPQSA
jgi:transposase